MTEVLLRPDGMLVGSPFDSGVLADWQIAELCNREQPMISPFEPEPVRHVWPNRELPKEKVISYGLTSYGYDIRVASKFYVFTPTSCAPVDPKEMSERAFDIVESEDWILIPPNSFALARTVECFDIPKDVLGLVVGKSTYARCGITVNCTPLEPGWKGYLTVEISNTTPLPARIYANEGIAQVLFFQGSAQCLKNYTDKNAGGKAGKYQDQQAEIVLPKA